MPTAVLFVHAGWVNVHPSAVAAEKEVKFAYDILPQASNPPFGTGIVPSSRPR